ncbi:11958_t:CDS:1, partial [Racocetra fulgida]
SLIIIPPNDAEIIHQKIPGATKLQGKFVVPCNTTTDIAFTLGGVNHNIDPRDLAFRPTDQNGLCSSGIAAENIAGNLTWIVGDVFLKNVYSVYNIKDLTVGFAKSKNF